MSACARMRVACLKAGQRGDLRAGRDQDVLRGELRLAGLAGHDDRVRVGDAADAVHGRHLVLLEQHRHALRQRLDRVGLLLHQLRQVQLHLAGYRDPRKTNTTQYDS